MDKISIIVPVYKAEKHIHKCVNSILAQDYDNIEILLVNDGSPDQSGQICDEYAKTEKKIKVIHKANGGVSSARNEGLDNATGEFVAFVDSDDWLEQDALSNLYNAYKAMGSDYIVASYNDIRKDGKECVVLENDTYSGDGVVENLYRIYLKTFTPWAKLYKKSLINENHIKFKDIPYGEDTVFNLEYIGYCRNISMISVVVYNYNRVTENSAMSKSYSDIDIYRKMIFNEAKKIIDKHNKSDLDKVLSDFANVSLRGIINHLILLTDDIELQMKKIADAYEYFEKYLNIGNKAAADSGISDKGYELLKKRQIYKFIKQWKKENAVRYYKTKIRQHFRRVKHI